MGMEIGIDVRAASWHTGSGLGTYNLKLIEGLFEIDHTNQYHFYWGEDKYVCADRTTLGKIVEERKDNFWPLMYLDNENRISKVDLFHNPVNGVGMPKGNCKMVVTIHDLIPYTMPETVDPPHLKYIHEKTQAVLEKADAVITVSQHSKKDIMNFFHYPQERITVTYLAPDPIYHPIEKKEAKEKIAWGYGISDDFLLYLGGFSPRKNVRGIIEGFAQVLKDYEGKLQLVVIGHPCRSFAELCSLVERLNLTGKVVFPGFVPTCDLPYFYSAAEVFLYPSLYEGFGLPPLEAVACGTPTIISNRSSLPEILGGGALQVDPDKPYSIGNAIYILLNNTPLREELKRRGLELAASFSWKKTAEKTLQVYNSLLDKGN
jgi:glycosyltransferase involved in cell wall biosynthesis